MRKQTPRQIQGGNEMRDIGRGAIVNITSTNLLAGLPGKMSYTVSKHAVMGLAKILGRPKFFLYHLSGLWCLFFACQVVAERPNPSL